MAKTPRPSTDGGIAIGQIFQGKYRVEEILGQGGMGIVARCTHLALNEQVAVKMLRADVLMDQDATARFMREAQAAVKLRSEYVARVSDVGTFENGVPYMVMEYLDGHDLGQLLEKQDKVAVQWAVELMLQAAEGLAEAHSINIVHRDVKPTNLFVTWRPDGSSLIKVLDFGISKSPMGTDMQLTQTQSLLGTPAYMSPEQMRSARLVDQRSDIWSLGTVMYELIEGRRPFEAESFSEMCVKVAVDPPSPMVNAPPALQAVILRCLAKSPEQRYPSMAELGRDLIPFARDPHQAQMLVERMFRMIGRQTPNWEMGSSPRAQTPVPGRAQTPVAWASDVRPVDTLKEKSAPAVLPIDVSAKRSKLGLVLAALVILGGAVGAGVFLFNREESKPSVKQAASPSTSPAAGSVSNEATLKDQKQDHPKQDHPEVAPPPPSPSPSPPPVADAKADDKPADAIKKAPVRTNKKNPRLTKKTEIKKEPEVKKEPEIKKDGKDGLMAPSPSPSPSSTGSVFDHPRPVR